MGVAAHAYLDVADVTGRGQISAGSDRTGVTVS